MAPENDHKYLLLKLLLIAIMIQVSQGLLTEGYWSASAYSVGFKSDFDPFVGDRLTFKTWESSILRRNYAKIQA